MRLASLPVLAVLVIAPGAEAAEFQGVARIQGGSVALRAVSSTKAWTVDVTAGNRRVQRFTVPTEAPEGEPWLADADGDGAPDLWVPTATGNVNTVYQVWLLNPRDGTFANGGEVSGFAFGREGADLISASRSSCCSVVYAVGVFAPAGVYDEAFGVEATINEAGRVTDCKPANDRPVPAGWLRRLCRLGDAELPGYIGPPRR